jgi:xylulokinase
MKDLVAAIDCGTSTVKAGVFDMEGNALGLEERDCSCQHQTDGAIEQDPETILFAAFSTLRRAVRESKVEPSSVRALSVTNQRASLVPVGADGAPVAHMISWEDLRGAPLIEQLRERIDDLRYFEITGVPNRPVFSLSKILWLRANRPEINDVTARFVLLHDYLLHELGCDRFVCDWSNASLTGLLDVSRRDWSEEMLDLVELDRGRLPELVPPGEVVGRLSAAAAARTGLGEGTILVAGGGDQQCAGLGCGAVRPGIMEVSLGTAAAPLSCVQSPVLDPKMRVSCCPHAVPELWEVEGLQNSAGASLNWLQNIFGDNKPFNERFLSCVGKLPPGADGVIFFPYLCGSSAPHWNPEATGMFLGLKATHDQHHLARAVMEGVSLETREIMDIFTMLDIPMSEVRLSGGCTHLEVWNEIQADIYEHPVSTLRNPHASLLGAAILAAKGGGAFPSVPKASDAMVQIDRTYRPDRQRSNVYRDLYQRYRSVYRDFDNAQLFPEICPPNQTK